MIYYVKAYIPLPTEYSWPTVHRLDSWLVRKPLRWRGWTIRVFWLSGEYPSGRPSLCLCTLGGTPRSTLDIVAK